MEPVMLMERAGAVAPAGTVRNVCHVDAGKVEAWHNNAPQAGEKFANSPGEIEFVTDGTCVNTMQGWKEMRVGVFSKRKRGEAAPPEAWDQRTLPVASERHAFAA